MVGGVGWARLWRKYLVGSRGVAKLRGPVPACTVGVKVKAHKSILFTEGSPEVERKSEHLFDTMTRTSYIRKSQMN